MTAARWEWKGEGRNKSEGGTDSEEQEVKEHLSLIKSLLYTAMLGNSNVFFLNLKIVMMTQLLILTLQM